MSEGEKMFTARRIILGGLVLAAIALAAMAGAVLWYSQLRGEAPATVTLAEAVAAVGSPTAAQNGADLSGIWELAAGGPSFVGYRVQEELANIGSNTAVGRTGALTAKLEIDGRTVRAVTVEADLRQLQSDSAMRDNALRQQALEIDRYPTASFVLAEPIVFDTVPAEGETVTVSAVGDLTIHGVTRRVTVPLQGQLTNGHIVVVGSLAIPFADYNIAPPRALRVLSVDDHGIMEFQLVFAKKDRIG